MRSLSDGDTLFRDVDVEGRRTDVLVTGGRITAIGHDVGTAREVVDGGGGALVPGLHDHHVHLMAAAAARESLDLATASSDAAAAIHVAASQLPAGQWLRVIGYHESMAGELDREALDALAPDRPTRVQHRSGAMWVLNSAALAELGTASGAAPPGFERDEHGLPTGRCMRMDTWLRTHLPHTRPDLDALVREIRAYGITGVTDMTPYSSFDDARPLLDASLPLRVVLTGSPALTSAGFPSTVSVGPVKIVLDEADPPGFDELVGWVRAAHRCGRAVAVHCVTRVAIALMVAVWDDAGAVHGDRVEHGAVVPRELATRLASHGVTVVTQPSLVASRGDSYLDDVDREDVPHLWPCRSLIEAGVAVAASTDAPYGPADPWLAIVAATTRRTATGRTVGAAETVSTARAFEMFLGPLEDPGGPTRRVSIGAQADLCLLDAPLAEVLNDPSSAHVRRTWVAGV